MSTGSFSSARQPTAPPPPSYNPPTNEITSNKIMFIKSYLISLRGGIRLALVVSSYIVILCIRLLSVS